MCTMIKPSPSFKAKEQFCMLCNDIVLAGGISRSWIPVWHYHHDCPDPRLKLSSCLEECHIHETIHERAWGCFQNGISVNCEYISRLRFAYDIVIIPESLELLGEILKNLNGASRRVWVCFVFISSRIFLQPCDDANIVINVPIQINT